MIQKWIPVWVVPVVLLMAIVTVWLRLSVVRTTYEVDQADKMLENARKEVERIELEIAKLRSPRRLVPLARTRFKLFPPRPSQFIRLYDDQIKLKAAR